MGGINESSAGARRGAHNEPLYDYRVILDEDRARRGLEPVKRKQPTMAEWVNQRDQDNYIDDQQLAMVNRQRASRGEGMLQKPLPPQTRNEKAGWGLLKALVDNQAEMAGQSLGTRRGYRTSSLGGTTSPQRRRPGRQATILSR